MKTKWIYGYNFTSTAKFKVQSRKVKIIESFHDDGFQKRSNGFPGDKLSTLPTQGTSEISTVEERSHIANANAH